MLRCALRPPPSPPTGQRGHRPGGGHSVLCFSLAQAAALVLLFMGRCFLAVLPYCATRALMASGNAPRGTAWAVFALLVLCVHATPLPIAALRRYLVARHLPQLVQRRPVTYVPGRSRLHFRIWVAKMLTATALDLVAWAQGTELYNCVLRLLGARIAPGAVIFTAKIDVPELLTVERNCTIGKSVHVRCVSIGLLETGRPMLALGRVHLQRNTSVGDQCALIGGCHLPPFSEVEANTDVCHGHSYSGPMSPETTWEHHSRCVDLGLQSLALAVAVLGPLYATLLGVCRAYGRLVLQPPDSLGGDLAALVALGLGWVAWHGGGLLLRGALFVVANRVIGAPALSRAGHTRWLPIGSWRFFRYVTLRQSAVALFGAPLFALQSSWIPTALLRAAGARIGARTIVFNSVEYEMELAGVPLGLLTIGSDTLVTTHVQVLLPRHF